MGELKVDVKGKNRDVFYIMAGDKRCVFKQFRYPNRHHLRHYLTDIRAHQIAIYYVQLFAEKSADKYRKLRIVEPQYFEIYTDASCTDVLDFGNIEEYVKHLKFIKLTNNKSYLTRSEDINPELVKLATAFSHFTFQYSGGNLMVTDLQGWYGLEGGSYHEILILTDPAIHSDLDIFGNTNLKRVGFSKFFTEQHSECNEICHGLNLTRPDLSIFHH